MSSDFYEDGTRKWQRFYEPFYWERYDITVVADRHLPNGKRQHIVIEDIEDTEIRNADIFSIKSWNKKNPLHTFNNFDVEIYR